MAVDISQKDKEEVFQLMIDKKILKFGYLIAALGAVPFYPETRWLFSEPFSIKLIAQKIAYIVNQLDVDLLAGCELGGFPVATAVSLEMDKPILYLRKEVKGYGVKSAVMGQVNKSWKKAILIDDATGAGEGKNKFAEHLEKEGIKVTDMVVIYYTGHPLVPWYQENNIGHHQVMLIEEFFHYALKVGYISKELYNLVWDGYADYNIERWSINKEKFMKVLEVAKKDGWPIENESLTWEMLVEDSKTVGKYHELPDGIKF